MTNENWGADPFRKPALDPQDRELCSEYGRVIRPSGGMAIDYRSHWLVLVKDGEVGQYALLVSHGGGNERISLGYRLGWESVLPSMDADARYLLLYTIYNAHREAATQAQASTGRTYQLAFLEGRLKRRKRNHRYHVEILPAAAEGRTNG